MCVILAKYKLFYASVPKVACTSIKNMFFEFENGFPFKNYTINGKKKNIHNTGLKSLLRENYPEQRIKDFYRVTVVRDPVKRFLSAYGNRVVHHKELSRKQAGPKLKELGLKPDPDLDLFIEEFEAYRQAHRSIFHHTRPMVAFLGDDPNYFSKVYRMEELDDFVTDVGKRLGTDLELGHRQAGGPKIKPDVLSAEQLDKIKSFYQKDYDAFGAYF